MRGLLVVGCALATAMLFVNGCGGGDSRNLPATVPASGYVYLDGNPVEGAAVVFIPEDIQSGNPAQAITNASGYFDLQIEGKKGAVPGRYIVQVAKTLEVPMEGGPQAAGESEDFRAVTYKNVLPAKYASIATSGLKVEVPESGIKDIKLELSTQP